MAPPVGLIIGGDGPRKPKWKIGKEVGTGACASVHILQDENNKASNWVVKIVPLPVKITKQKKSLPERNARLINHELSVYRNQFPDCQGYILPSLPSHIGPPVEGQVKGFTFLVMERMQAPLWDVVPALLKGASDTVAIGPIAEQLLTCVEKIHGAKHVLIDIKPENFMLSFKEYDRKKASKHQTSAAPVSSKKAANSTVAEDLATKVRLLDLGLVAPLYGAEGHRPDDGISEIIGTPLYSSLNVHELRTPSRRDDMEALGYVVAELIIRIVAASNGEAAAFEGTNDTEIPTYLPWSRQPSDTAIGKMKATEVKIINSNFYKRMGNKGTAKTMKAFFDLTQAMKYKEVPDYAEFREMLSSLVVAVDVPKKKAAATKKKKPATGRTTTTRATRSKRAVASMPSEDDTDDEGSPQKHQKVAAEANDEDGFVDAAMEVDDTDTESYHDSAEVMEEMDWEPSTSKENAQKPGTRLGLTIMITDGPHKGENFELLKGEVNSVVIGKNPTAVSKPTPFELYWPLHSDTSVGDSHVKLELRATKQSSSVKVTDLKSGKTIVNQTTVKKGNNVQAFIGGSFVVGDSTFTIHELAEQCVPLMATKTATKKKTPLAQKKQASTAKSAATKKAPPPAKQSKSSKTGPGAILEVVSGPHKGESFCLVKDETEIINLGSAPSAAKKGEPVVLASDGSIEKRHARLQLVASKKLVKVSVTDVSESAGTFVNGKQTNPGKEHMAFVNDEIKIGETVLLVKLV